MSLKKLSLSLSLFAAFGLMACGDDSSSGSSSDVISCKFSTTETSYKMVAEGGDYYVVDESSVDGPSHTSITTSIVPEEELKEACSTEGDVPGMMETKCEGNKLILTIKTVLPSEDAAKTLLEKQKNDAEKRCKEIDGKTVKEVEKSFFDDEGDEDDESGLIKGDDDDENGLIKGDDEGECDEECLRRLEEALEEQFGEGEVIEE